MKKTIITLTTTLGCAALLTAGTNKEMDHYRTNQFQKVDDTTYDTRRQSSDILDATVMSRENEEIGTVKDFELGENGEITALYIELNDGFLGLVNNTVVRVRYDAFEVSSKEGEFRFTESTDSDFSKFVSNIVNATKEGADYVADKAEQGADYVVEKSKEGVAAIKQALKNDRKSRDYAKSISINVRNDRVVLTGKVPTKQDRDRIEDIVEDHTSMEVINNITVR